MRKRPISSSDRGRIPIQVDPTAHRDIAVIAELMNESEKPEGFPRTSHGKYRAVRLSAATAACTALIRDMLASGEITVTDLLERLADF